MSAVLWSRQSVAGVPLRVFVGTVGEIVIGTVEFDGSNRLWVWSSPLSDEAWGYAPTEEGAKQALELWVKAWVQKFRAFFD